MLRTDSGGERECNLIQLRDLSHFWPAQLWKEICPGLWHHSLLHAGTVSWSTDAVGFVCVFGTWSCDNELGKVLWVSYRTDVTVSGDGYLLTKGRIRSAFIGICLMWLSLLLDETRPNAAILRYLVETTSYFSAFVTSFFFFLPPLLVAVTRLCTPTQSSSSQPSYIPNSFFLPRWLGVSCFSFQPLFPSNGWSHLLL